MIRRAHPLFARARSCRLASKFQERRRSSGDLGLDAVAIAGVTIAVQGEAAADNADPDEGDTQESQSESAISGDKKKLLGTNGKQQ